MIEAKTYKNFDLGKLNFDLSAQLDDSMLVVKKDIQDHVAKGERIDGGGKFAKNKVSTIKRKLASEDSTVVSHANDVLIATENLWFNQKIKKATKQSQRAEMTIGSTRDKIAVYLQEGDDNKPARPYFGISEEAEQKVERLVVLQIDRMLRDS